MQRVKQGEIVVARVTGIAKFGLFVIVDDIIPGLVHISEISEHFVRDVGSVAEIGELILVKIVSVKDDKLVLSIKDLNYKVKKASIKIKEPALKYSTEDFKVLKNNVPKWIEIYDKERLSH